MVSKLFKLKKIPVQMELFHKQISNLFFYESFFSSWPLWVISLTELQKWYNGIELDVDIFNYYEHLLLIIKVFCGGILILLTSDKISGWFYAVGDPIKLVIKCKNNPYIPMKLITKRGRKNTYDGEDCNKCYDCKELFFAQFGGPTNEIEVFHCSGYECCNYL